MKQLVEELDADFDDGETKTEETTPKPTTVGLKPAFNKADSDDKTGAGGAAKEDKDGEVEIGCGEEDVEDGDEGKKPAGAKELTAKLDHKKEEEVEKAAPVKRTDYSLLDELTSFLYNEEDPLSILCGYFFKIMEQLLNKQK